MTMEHTGQSFNSIHDLAHIENMSGNQAKMEIMLLKIAIDAVDAYNHICKDHQIELVSIDDSSVSNEVDSAINSQREAAKTEANDQSEEVHDNVVADEEAIAVLSEALEGEENHHLTEADDMDYDSDDSVTAEMISDMIGGNQEQAIDASSQEITSVEVQTAELNASFEEQVTEEAQDVLVETATQDVQASSESIDEIASAESVEMQQQNVTAEEAPTPSPEISQQPIITNEGQSHENQ